MIVSYKLLQTYFSKKLPKPEVLADALTFHAFEIEGMEKKGADTAIDVKVLPNRAHDCLSHNGIAREIGAILDIPFEPLPKTKLPSSKKKGLPLSVTIKDKRAVRYAGIVIDGVAVKDSPAWLKAYLATLGQRSINNVVDATNFVMFVLGQPLHAFDYHKVSGGHIIVRPGKEGESLTTLDGKVVSLNQDIMLIADKKESLVIAGIKGGIKAEIDKHTTTLIIEAANFNASSVRMTAQRIGIKTDASKRYESGLSPYVIDDALALVVSMIVEIAGTSDTWVGTPVDVFPKKPKQESVTVTLRDINKILGLSLSDTQVQTTWKRFGFVNKVKKTKGDVLYTVSIPHERLDLRLKEDLVEEVGRLHGYHDLPSVMPVLPVISPDINKEWFCRDVVREVMLGAGFSDVYTYAFLGQGEIEVANPIANDKRFLRNNLMNGLKLAVVENLKYENEVRIFEFGHIFGKSKGQLTEESSFAALMGFQKRKESQMKSDFYFLKGVLEQALLALGLKSVRFEEAGGELVASIFSSPSSKVKGLPMRGTQTGKNTGDVLLGTMSIHGFELDFAKVVDLANVDVYYKVPSRYPSIIRDVSLFVPMATRAGDVQAIIASHAGELMQSVTLIDVFEQPEQSRKSLAYRITLQSFERTLADQEANAVYERVVSLLRSTNSEWVVRT